MLLPDFVCWPLFSFHNNSSKHKVPLRGQALVPMTFGAPQKLGQIPPVVGDALIFSGSSRLVNTNDLDMANNAWLRFDSTDFVLNGNPLFLQQGITNSVGTNKIALNLNWGALVGQNVFVAPDSELVIAGTLTNTLVNHTNTGGGRVRITGAYLQSVNAPATVLNNIEYVIDGGTFTSAGGVRIASGTTPSNSKMVLTNGAVMTQTLSGGAIRVGDFAGLTGELIMHDSTFLHSGGEIGIGFTANAIGVVKQFGGRRQQRQSSCFPRGNCDRKLRNGGRRSRSFGDSRTNRQRPRTFHSMDQRLCLLREPLLTTCFSQG